MGSDVELAVRMGDVLSPATVRSLTFAVGTLRAECPIGWDMARVFADADEVGAVGMSDDAIYSIGYVAGIADALGVSPVAVCDAICPAGA